ncbi:MAG: RDD family protein [Pseudomonadota bacterium]|nr:RDD family protein [Pseudomonadota bacterium]
MIQADSLTYGGFWRRFGAVMIDSSLVFIVLVYGGLALLFMILPRLAASWEDIGWTLLWAIPAVWAVLYTLMEVVMTSFWGATPGKLALEMKVLGPDGQYPSIPRSLARFLVKLVTTLILSLGALTVPFSKRKRALHDMVASSVVIWKP